MDWDELFMRAVYLISMKSRDTSTSVGAILVRNKSQIGSGFNGIPMGVNDNVTERYIKPAKLNFFSHAESNSIYFCARFGIRTEGTIMYTNGLSCSECCKAVIQAGISKLIIHKQWNDIFSVRTDWMDSVRDSGVMFREAGVEIVEFDKFLGIKTLLGGKIIEV